jgi:hypothetical protein
MAWAVAPEVGALGIVALAACTIPNPAYEGGEQESTGPLGTSEAGDLDIGVEASTTPGETDATPGTTSTGTTGETGETGPTTSGETTASGGTETGDEEPLPQIGPFDPPVPVEILNDPIHQDDDPTLPADMLELYFASSRGIAGDIFVARREQVNEPWGVPEVVTSLSSPWVDNTPEISADGLVIYFSSNRDGLPDEDVFVSTRPNRDSEWLLPMRVAALSTALMRDVCPFITDEGLHVYGCVGNPFLPELDLVRFDREGLAAPWSAGTPLMELNTPGLECAAWLDPSERVLAFMSDRPGGPGQIDLWLASRPTTDDPFEPPSPIVELNSVAVDEDPWMSPDGGTVYFASERHGTLDIFMAVRAR